MQKQKHLLFARNVFLFIIFVIFGVIIVTEKSAGILTPKIQEEMDAYIENNYSSITNSINKKDAKYNKTIYKRKIVSKENKNHYFYIIYKNKKIKDTYKEDYLEGKNLLNHIKKTLEKEITNTTNLNTKVKINTTLNNYTKSVQERIIKEDNLKELKFYTIEKEIIIDNWNSKDITEEIHNTIAKYYNNKITPRSYTITITNKKDITESIRISNLTENFLINTSKEQIIDDIIKDKNSTILKENKIEYKYLN